MYVFKKRHKCSIFRHVVMMQNWIIQRKMYHKATFVKN